MKKDKQTIMNILIIGTGAIGISLACSMISQKANVSLFAREETANAITTNGMKRTGIFNEITCKPDEFKVFTRYEDLPKDEFDFIFISSKTIANDDISTKLSQHKDILKEKGKIIIFQNGFGNDEPYLRFFDKSQVYCARVITGFARPERHISEVTVHAAPILLGSLQNEPVECLAEVAEMINNSGIESHITDELAKDLWAKMLYNCTLNPLGAVLRVNYGKLTENDYTVSIMNQIIEEIFEVIHASGYSTHWENSEEYKKLFYSQLVPDTYDHKASTLQDIEKKTKTEIDTLTGTVVSLAKKHNVDVPTNEMLYKLIKAIESEF